MNRDTRLKSVFHEWILPAIVSIGLLFGSAGCGPIISRAATADPASAVANCDTNKVTITGVHWFQDKAGAWRVVGLIVNNSTKAVSKLVTGVETRTSSDRAADQGEDISAYPLNLQPGERAPFIAWIDREIPGLDHFEVEIAECVLAEPADRSQVNLRGGQVSVDDDETAQVTAELVNPAASSILVNGLMVAVYDQSGALITAQYADVTPRYLAPGESGPVRASLDLPKGAGPKVSSYKLFMDVLVNQSSPLPLNSDHAVQLLSSYVDQAGHFHQVGQLTNSGPTGIMTSLQATAYSDKSRSLVADAAQMTTWVPVMPGETLPFDLTDWGPLNHSKGLADEWAGKKTSLGLRLEPFLTWTTAANVKDLTLSDGTVSFANQEALFAGKATNASDSGITSGSVTAVLRDKSNGQIIAVGSAHLDITDSAAPGQVLYYSIAIPLPAKTDPKNLDTEITAKGYQP